MDPYRRLSSQTFPYARVRACAPDGVLESGKLPLGVSRQRRTGTLEGGGWTASLPKARQCTSGPGAPALVNGMLYTTAIAADHAVPELYAIDPRSGDIHWHTVLLDCLQYTAPPLVQDGVIYLTTSGHRSGSFPLRAERPCRGPARKRRQCSGGRPLSQSSAPRRSSPMAFSPWYPITIQPSLRPHTSTRSGQAMAHALAKATTASVTSRSSAMLELIIVGTGAEDASHPQRIIEAYSGNRRTPAVDHRDQWPL